MTGCNVKNNLTAEIVRLRCLTQSRTGVHVLKLAFAMHHHMQMRSLIAVHLHVAMRGNALAMHDHMQIKATEVAFTCMWRCEAMQSSRKLSVAVSHMQTQLFLQEEL